jgi:hypothetical protein
MGHLVSSLVINHPISLFDPVAIISSSRSDCFIGLAAARSGPLLGSGRQTLAGPLLWRVRFPYASFSVDDYDDTEESSPSGASIAPQTCIRSIHADRNHDAVMRIGGEAPRRRAHSKSRLIDHVQSRVATTSVRSSTARRQHDSELQKAQVLGAQVATPPDEAADLRALRRLSLAATV